MRHQWMSMAHGYKCSKCKLKRIFRDRKAKAGKYDTVLECVYRFPDGHEVVEGKTPPCPGARS